MTVVIDILIFIVFLLGIWKIIELLVKLIPCKCSDKCQKEETNLI